MKLFVAPVSLLLVSFLAFSVHAQEQVTEKLSDLIVPELEFSGTPLTDAVTIIQQKSVELDPAKQGVNIVILSPELRKKPVTLKLKNATLSDTIRYTSMLVNARMNTTRFAVTISSRNVDKVELVVQDTESMEARLENIILPKVEFKDTPLVEALDFLVSQSGELDPSRKGGVNIIYRGEREAEGRAPITLQLSNIPLRETLKYTAQIASHNFVIEPNAVVVSRDG